MPPIRHVSESPHIKFRQRSRRACAPCRKRKSKCDGNEPCAACVGYGYDCVYAEPQSASKPQMAVKKAASDSTPGTESVAVPSASLSLGGTAAPSPSNGTVLQNHDAQHIASESVVPEDNSALLNQSIKTRFTTSSSAIAFPTMLGLSLGVPNVPRLQAFGWNPGTRQEIKALPARTICDIISRDEMTLYADKYFKEVYTYFKFMDQEYYLMRCGEFWESKDKRGTDLEALICYVVALGSYFSGSNSLPAEAEVVEHGRVLLDLSTAHPPGLLSFKHVSAWVLRTIYLRSTTRPHLSFMASCTSMHIAEAVGLHRDIVKLGMRQKPPRHICHLEEEMRRRTFWIAMSLNRFLAAEYGRTTVHLESIDCPPLVPTKDDLVAQTVAIMQAMPSTTATLSDLPGVLETATSLPVDSPFLGLLRADVCFCIYRRFKSTNTAMEPAQITAVLEVIRVALDGVKFLKTMDQPWWNIVSTPFHAVCVLLSLGTTESMTMIPSALDTLKKTVEVYDSHISKEAVRTACMLVQGARAKLTQEIESLDVGLAMIGDVEERVEEHFDWGMGQEFGLFDYLDFGSMVGYDDPNLIPSEFRW